MTTFFLPIAKGIGDGILCIPVIQSLQASEDRLVVVARSPKQMVLAQILPGPLSFMSELEFQQMTLAKGDRVVNLRDHPLQTEYEWDKPEFEQAYPGWTICQVIEKIAQDFGIRVDFSQLKPLPYSFSEAAFKKVVLVPNSGGPYKMWPLEKWLHLYQFLVSAGLQAVVVGENRGFTQIAQLVEAGLPHLPTATFKDALDVVSTASLVISVDTALKHLALQQRTKVVALYPTSYMFVRQDPLCDAFVAGSCDPDCASKKVPAVLTPLFDQYEEFEPVGCEVPDGRRCINKLQPESVAKGVIERLGRSSPLGSSSSKAF